MTTRPWRISRVSPVWITCLWVGAMVLGAVPAVHAQWPAELQQVATISTVADEVVLGSDGEQLIVLSRPADSEDWLEGQTRIASITEAPWVTGPAEPWGRVPSPEPAWAALGELIHVDIDPETDMAVISTRQSGRHSVWFSGRQPDGKWSRPWPLNGLREGMVEATFAMFDPDPDREGDLLLALRPPSRSAEEALENRRGQWQGGWDVARIPRRGNYSEVWFMDDLNTTADEWALTPHPVQGGWLSTERMAGRGGVDVWWCPALPLAEEAPAPANALLGHTLTVECGGRPVAWMTWQVKDLESGVLVDQVLTDKEGVARLDRLAEGARYQWRASPPPNLDCPKAMATWRDADGQVLQRFSLFEGAWVLNMLTALDIGVWRVRAMDRSLLPNVLFPDLDEVLSETKADWVVFHTIGSADLRGDDALRVKAWAQQWKQESEGMLVVLGHASSDGDPVANRRLAEERARQVAVHLEFAGIPPDRIRIEGRGSDEPLVQCPDGVECPGEAMARSRRTELYPISDLRP